jgi:hypothetical protein
MTSIKALLTPKLLISLPLFLCICLGGSGCATSQTLGAQFGICPLPTKVARKLYGTCGACYIVRPDGSADANPNCPYCKKIQYYNRERAAALNRNALPVAGVPYQTHRQAIYSQVY